MKRFLHLSLVLSIAAIAAKWICEKFVIKADENDPDGFIMQTAGFGMDDIAVGLVFGAVSALALGFAGPR